MSAQKPLESILARNLLSSISTPAFLVREQGALLFYNDAATAMLGRRFPSLVSFREAESVEWEIGPAKVRAQAVNHRGPTLGYRIEDSDWTLCYIPDHEPGLGTPLSELDADWISGFELALDATMLIHDCQYTDQEYPSRPLSDAPGFGHRVGGRRLLRFHHDPLHTDDFLDTLSGEIEARWQDLGGHPAQVELATERREIAIFDAAARAA
jgi:hypothetical protein